MGIEQSRFWSKVDRQPYCWLWTGGRDWDGYGFFWLDRRNIRAHRHSWMIHYGDIPDGLCVLHRCDNPPCVNPEHLFLGSNADNTKDRDSKGRQTRHEGHHMAKLKNSDIPYIRFLRSLGLEQKVIAGLFSVTQANVSHILNGRSWRHIP